MFEAEHRPAAQVHGRNAIEGGGIGPVIEWKGNRSEEKGPTFTGGRTVFLHTFQSSRDSAGAGGASQYWDLC